MQISQEPPIVETENQQFRIRGTRIGLEVIIEDYVNGDSAEEISLNYDALTLTDVYAILHYYHSYRSEVDGYIKRITEDGEAIRAEVEAQHNLAHLRSRLRERQQNSMK